MPAKKTPAEDAQAPVQGTETPTDTPAEIQAAAPSDAQEPETAPETTEAPATVEQPQETQTSGTSETPESDTQNEPTDDKPADDGTVTDAPAGDQTNTENAPEPAASTDDPTPSEQTPPPAGATNVDLPAPGSDTGQSDETRMANHGNGAGVKTDLSARPSAKVSRPLTVAELEDEIDNNKWKRMEDFVVTHWREGDTTMDRMAEALREPRDRLMEMLKEAGEQLPQGAN